jgi:replication-associated recombination protein RarA
METLFSTETQTALQFPASLTDAYKPQTLDDARWCGLEKQRKILANLAKQVRLGSVILLEGPPGVGKTSLAFAFSRSIPGGLRVVSHLFAASEYRHVAGSGASVFLRANGGEVSLPDRG